MASKRAVRRRQCGRKRRYRTPADAANALRHQPKAWGFMHAYLCSFCRQFHLGHPPRKIREALAGSQST